MASVCIIGSGKAAAFFARLLKEKGHTIEKIVSRNPESGKRLSISSSAPLEILGSNISSDADFIFIAVKDSAVAELASKVEAKGIIIHLSGALGLPELSNPNGVIWPLMTLGELPSMPENIPLIIEGSDQETTEKIRLLAESLSSEVSLVNAEQRARLHLAAVFSANFTNHLYQIAWEICKKNELSFQSLLPLIQQVIRNLGSNQAPAEFQTGPALRKDEPIMRKHEELLNSAGMVDEASLYRMISEMIQASAQKKNL